MAKSHLLMFFWLPHCPVVQSTLGAEQSKQEMGARALGLVSVGFSPVPRAHSADSDPGPSQSQCFRALGRSYQAFAYSVLMGLGPLAFSLPVDSL